MFGYSVFTIVGKVLRDFLSGSLRVVDIRFH